MSGPYVVVDMADALQRVTDLVRALATTPEDREAVNMVEDLAVNKYGDDA